LSNPHYNPLRRFPKEILKKASIIKAIFFDVDGVLTDGKIIYDEVGKEIKAFHVRDGLIISYLKKAGIITGGITGRESPIVSGRFAELRIDFCHQGIVDKALAFDKLIAHYKLKAKEVVYIGDDLNDLPVFKQVGLAVCPADTYDYIKDRADYVTTVKGGQGVLREVADLVLEAQGWMEKFLKQ
jgi:3-deoxy-D-manno-octulosonate 8-phosphate phosphatase (KDO 8-P phosphatase)